MVERATAEAGALKALRLPTLSAAVGVTRTDEPMMAFGTKLNQARIAQTDFLPSALNHPDPVTGTGATLTLSQPLYAGGRLDAAFRAGTALAEAEAAAQAHRRQQVALAVVQAYFGAQMAQQGVDYAEDTLRQARETERFVQAQGGAGADAEVRGGPGQGLPGPVRGRSRGGAPAPGLRPLRAGAADRFAHGTGGPDHGPGRRCPGAARRRAAPVRIWKPPGTRPRPPRRG